jgi:multicomponent Na+:H+ antiporter subunit F
MTAVTLPIVLDVVALALLVSLVGGLVRVWRGPRAEDRMLTAQLFGTTGVGLLIVLAGRSGERALRDVALVLAVLAVLAVVAFVGRVGVEPADRHDDTGTER